MSRKKDEDKRNWTWLIALVLFVALSFVLYQNRDKQVGSLPKTDASKEQAVSKDSNQPTQAQQDFVANILLPTLDRAKISYPVPSIRTRFATCMKRISDGQVALQVSATPSHQGGIAAAFKDLGGKLIILISVPAAMDALVGARNDRELFTDYLVGIMLHEEYHLIVQGGKRPDELSFDEMVQSESEAWWFTVKEVYLPMIRAGRMKLCDQATKEGLDAYEQANGDRNHPAWIKFSRSATGMEPQ